MINNIPISHQKISDTELRDTCVNHCFYGQLAKDILDYTDMKNKFDNYNKKNKDNENDKGIS